MISAAPILLEPGFKFKPTDEDVVVHYLRPRAMNEPLPSGYIVDVDILNHNPWELVPGIICTLTPICSQETRRLNYSTFI